MKTLVLFITMTTLSFISNAQESQEHTITITVPNVNNNDGKVLFALYTEDTFMKRAPIQTAAGEIKNGKTTVTFTNVPQGEYGITCVHDANNNGKMDFEANGMPKENYGVSNNNMSYGPPSWNDAKFTVNQEDLTLEIRL
ncbi:DUF2141 domain-containing protein [Aquimarina brevivitae]|uniref:Uncharacterized protein (DUF2141 family) n=1 Tax=Aquimarina brevivitae TaxID=323412 RepID=A0A4Q7P0K1_9FLAO|nr:DUF2141 domain-containing protein [Aquimarina brevivitae]RZS93323.1 uncharacterized protein (DUF2141 family) [Aquimarina brevivitae]